MLSPEQGLQWQSELWVHRDRLGSPKKLFHHLSFYKRSHQIASKRSSTPIRHQWVSLEPLYTLLSESSLVDFVSISHTAKRLPPKIRICLVCYQKEIWSKQHGSNWGLQESQIRHSFSQVSEIFQISVDLASFQLLEKLKKVCPWHVQACPSGNFPTFI